MTIDELLALRQREARRLAEAMPFSPEWDAAMTALEEIDEAVRSCTGEASLETEPDQGTGAGGMSSDNL